MSLVHTEEFADQMDSCVWLPVVVSLRKVRQYYTEKSTNQGDYNEASKKISS